MYLIACLETDGSNQSPALHEYRDQQRKLIRTTVAVDHRHAMLRSRRTTAVLFDVKMPELDGIFFARMFTILSHMAFVCLSVCVSLLLFFLIVYGSSWSELND